MALKIGALAARTGLTAATIRYYEEIGLLPGVRRQEGGQRVYGVADEERLVFIRRYRDFGFSIPQVRSLVRLFDDPASSCTAVRDLAMEHLAEVRRQRKELEALERTLVSLVVGCDQACVGGPGPACVIFAP